MRRESESLRAEFLGFPQAGFDVLTVRRGREALFVLLKSSGLAPGCGVGVPLYVCSCVPHAVREAGFQPVYIETDPNTLGLDLADLAHKSELIDGLVLVYTLGRPVDFTAIQRILPGKTIIEDCAHAIGSYFNEHPLGALGNSAFFTFGFFKPISAGGGGVIVSRDREIIHKARSLIAESPREGWRNSLRHSLMCVAKGLAFTNPIYSILSKLTSSMNDDGEGPIRVSRVISDSLRMRGIDKAVISRRIVEGQRSTEAFWNELRTQIPDGWRVPTEPAFGRWNHFMFAVQAPNAMSCRAALHSLRSHGISAAGLFPNCRREMQSAGYAGECPTSEHLANVTFLIPCHQALSRMQRKQIIEAIPSCLRTL